MTENEIHILDLPRPGRLPNSRLYYYQGNFFYPFDLMGNEPGRVKKAIRTFMKENGALVASDRADLGYKTLMELCDE